MMIFTTPAIVVYFVPWRRHAAAMESAQPKERVIVNHPTLDLGARCFVMPTQLATDMVCAPNVSQNFQSRVFSWSSPFAVCTICCAAVFLFCVSFKLCIVISCKLVVP